MPRLFVDMDGTLTRFHDEINYIERMWEKDFFLNLKPFDEFVQGLKMFIKNNSDTEVFILSAAIDGEPPYCVNEKNKWLDTYLPEIDKEHRIFTNIGKPKASYIPKGINNDDYLFDDYNKNLIEWQEYGGISIKCKNNINHKGLVGEIWKGKIIDNSSPPSLLAYLLRREMSETQEKLQNMCNKIAEAQRLKYIAKSDYLVKYDNVQKKNVPLKSTTYTMIEKKYYQLLNCVAPYDYLMLKVTTDFDSLKQSVLSSDKSIIFESAFRIATYEQILYRFQELSDRNIIDRLLLSEHPLVEVFDEYLKVDGGEEIIKDCIKTVSDFYDTKEISETLDLELER